MMSQLNCSLDTKIISASCDESLLLDMAHLTEEISFSSLYDVNSTQSALINNTSGIAIPKIARPFKNDIDSQIDPNILNLEMSFIRHDIDLDDPLSSSFGACGGSEYDDMVGPFSPSLWSPSHDEIKPCFLDSGKLDLNQDPTLAELNANPELIGNFDFEDLLLPDEKSSILPAIDFDITKPSWESEKGNMPQQMSSSDTASTIAATNFPASTMVKEERSGNVDVTTTIQTRRQRSMQESSTLPKRKISTVSSLKEATHKKSTLHELLTQSCMPLNEQISQPVSISSSKLQLSSSAPPQTSFEQNWGNSSQHSVVPVTVTLISDPPTSAPVETATETASVSSPVKTEIDSNDEGFDSEPEDTDHYEEFSSDVESTISDDADSKQGSSPSNNELKMSKKEKFFWQYNVQAKGPKISRLTLSPKNPDPHTLNEVMDPVFSPACLVQGIKHSGKARRGDGNDLTPNPKKLYQIGQELRKLNKIINDLTPVSEMPFNARPRSRKEKNKLASRACRLKKKAQHEANKLKLYGLELEHKKLLYALVDIRKIFAQYVLQHENTPETDKLSKDLELIFKANTKTKVAGHTAEFVNAVLEKISKGTSTGLLEEL